MNFKLSKLLTFALVLLAYDASAATTDNSCDKIWENIVNGCLSMRNSILTLTSTEPKDVCCSNAKYELCIQSAKAYSTVAKLANSCESTVYEQQIRDLEAPITSVQKTCTDFNTRTCVSDSMSQYWDQITSQINTKKVSDSIESNFNQAMSQLSAFAKNIGDKINEQNIPDRLKEGTQQLQSAFSERSRVIGDMISGQGQNRYSIVSDDKVPLESGEGLVDSLFPEFEFVEKKDTDRTVEAPVETPSNQGNGWQFMDWIRSGVERAQNLVRRPAANDDSKTPSTANNPYSVQK